VGLLGHPGRLGSPTIRILARQCWDQRQWLR
jgi:hypothetical protein